jgi:hypothetical protein
MDAKTIQFETVSVTWFRTFGDEVSSLGITASGDTGKQVFAT